MIVDAQLMFSTLQTIDGTAALPSTNVIDTGPLYAGNTGRAWGVGEPLYLFVRGSVGTGALSGTLTVNLVTDSAEPATPGAAFGSALSIMSMAGLAIPTATGAELVIAVLALPPKGINPYERFLGLLYTASADHNSELSLSAGIVRSSDLNAIYASGLNFA